MVLLIKLMEIRLAVRIVDVYDHSNRKGNTFFPRIKKTFHTDISRSISALVGFVFRPPY